MGRVILVRHGTTAYNRGGVGSDRIRSHKDVPLTDEGRQEGRELAHKFQDRPIAEIHTSDLSRSFDTARMIAQYHRKAKFVSTEALRSWDMGELTGKLTSPDVVQQIKDFVHNDTTAPRGGEAFKEFASRLLDYGQDVFDDAKTLAGEDCILIVTHGRCVEVLTLWVKADCDEECMHRDFADELAEEPDAAKPGDYVEVTFEDGKWAVVKSGEDDESEDAEGETDTSRRVYGKTGPSRRREDTFQGARAKQVKIKDSP